MGREKGGEGGGGWTKKKMTKKNHQKVGVMIRCVYDDALQHMQHAATRCITLPHAVTHCQTLQSVAPRCIFRIRSGCEDQVCGRGGCLVCCSVCCSMLQCVVEVGV